MSRAAEDYFSDFQSAIKYLFSCFQFDDSDTFEEIQTMEAIYPDEWKCFSSSSYRLTIRNENHEVLMFITLVENYPFLPPKIELSAPTLTRYQKATLLSIIDDISR